MVERTSEEFNLNVQNVAPTGINLGVGAYRAPDPVQESAGEQALRGLLNVGGQLVDQAIDVSVQQAYLQGQRARMAGEAQDAVESDVFSRPFVNGGYETEDYRIAQATMAAELNNYIKEQGRTLPPAEFAKVVQARAAKYTRDFEGLPAAAKLQAINSQQKMEEGLFTSQATEYQKYVIDQGSKRYLAQGNQIITDLVNAGDPGTKQANVERAALFYTDLLTAQNLPQGTREEMATQYLGSLVEADQRSVVEQLRNSGMLNALTFEQRKTLDAAMRKSEARTLSVDSLGMVKANADFEASLIAGNATADDVSAYIAQEVNSGRMSYDEAVALRLKYVKGLSNKDDTMSAIRAVTNGNLGELAALGYTGAEGIELVDKQLAANNIPLVDRLRHGLNIGTRIGELPKSFGETVAMAVRAVGAAGPDDPVNQELSDVLNATASTLAVAEQTKPGARGVLLQAMPEDTRASMAYMLRQQDLGVPPQQSLREFAANREAFAKLDALSQGFKTNQFQKDLADRVESEVTSGFFGRIGNALSGNSNLSTNPYNSRVFGAAVQDELSRITDNRDNMGLDVESALDLAVSNVQARTIQVGQRGFLGTGDQRRQLILPAGITAEQVFGSNDKSAIGRILNEQFPPAADGFESSFVFNKATGRLENIQINDVGQVVQRDPVDARGIGAKISEAQQAVYKQAQDAHFGAAVEVGGETFRINGGNTYGIPVRRAYEFRKELLGFEGYRDTVYKDRNGLAVGIGRNVTGQLKEGDKISKEQAEQWFMEDTDDALRAGQNLSAELGVRDETARIGLAGAIFQLGAAGLREHSRTAEAIRNKDYTSFINELRSSQWAKQTPNRVEWFISKMAGHFLP